MWSPICHILTCKIPRYFAESYKFRQLISIFQNVGTLRLLKIYIMFCPTAGEKYPFFPAPILGFFYLTRFAQKGFLWPKSEKLNTAYCLRNSAYSNQSSAKFQFKLRILIFGPNLPKNASPVENKKSEHHHGIAHLNQSRYKIAA